MDQTIRRLTQELSALNLDNSVYIPPQEPVRIEHSSTSLWASFDKQVAESVSRRSSTTYSMIELGRYFEEVPEDRKKDPLEWWQRTNNVSPSYSSLLKNIYVSLAPVYQLKGFSPKLEIWYQKGETG